MKQLFFTKIGNLKTKETGTVALFDMPMPEPGPEDIVIKVAYSSICGSDSHVLRGNLGEMGAGLEAALPIPFGHELSGTIENLGARAEALGFKKGDRVTANFMQYCNACDYCRTGRENICPNTTDHYDAYSEYVCWHMSQVYKVPDHVSLLAASQTEPMTIAINALKTVHVKYGTNLAIFGAGGIGLMAVALAKLGGASKITVFEPVASKRELALKCGADVVIDPTAPDAMELAAAASNGLGFDAVVESSGAASAAEMGVKLLGRGGHIVFFAMYSPYYTLPTSLFNEFYIGTKHFHGMYTSTDCFPEVISLLDKIDFSNIIEKVYDFEDCQAAFDAAMTGQYAKIAMKVFGE